MGSTHHTTVDAINYQISNSNVNQYWIRNMNDMDFKISNLNVMNIKFSIKRLTPGHFVPKYLRRYRQRSPKRVRTPWVGVSIRGRFSVTRIRTAWVWNPIGHRQPTPNRVRTAWVGTCTRCTLFVDFCVIWFPIRKVFPGTVRRWPKLFKFIVRWIIFFCIVQITAPFYRGCTQAAIPFCRRGTRFAGRGRGFRGRTGFAGNLNGGCGSGLCDGLLQPAVPFFRKGPYGDAFWLEIQREIGVVVVIQVGRGRVIPSLTVQQHGFFDDFNCHGSNSGLSSATD